MTMNRTFARIGLALTLAALLPVAASAQTIEKPKTVVIGPGQAFVIETDWWRADAATTQGRKDVIELQRPPTPYGPITPGPLCTPAAPFCS
jgi:hypothetical protein